MGDSVEVERWTTSKWEMEKSSMLLWHAALLLPSQHTYLWKNHDRMENIHFMPSLITVYAGPISNTSAIYPTPLLSPHRYCHLLYHFILYRSAVIRWVWQWGTCDDPSSRTQLGATGLWGFPLPCSCYCIFSESVYNFNFRGTSKVRRLMPMLNVTPPRLSSIGASGNRTP